MIAEVHEHGAADLGEAALSLYGRALREGGIPAEDAARVPCLGHTAIAGRLGMNVRTTRVHIARLAAALGSESRARLGYLIGGSGIPEQAPGPRE